jgi:hypothetical protein
MSSFKTFRPINPADAIPVDRLMAMCEAARTKYAAEIAADDHFKWYKDFIRFDFKLNDHSTGCKFENVEVFYNGKWRWLQVLIKKERLNGSIQPIDASEAARLSAELSSSKFQREIKPREVTAKPYTCINMTRQRVETEEKASYLIKAGFEFDPTELSTYYKWCDQLDDALFIEMDARISSGLIATTKKGKPKDVKLVGSITVTSLCSKAFSDKNKNVGGLDRPNPFAKLKINVSGSMVRALLEDYATAYLKPGSRVPSFKALLADGEPVTNENIHLAIGAGDEIVSGVIDMHSVCYSNMGIGVQAYLNRAVIKKRAGYDPAAFDEAFGETIEVDEDLQKLMASNAARVSAIAIDEDETKEEAVDAEVFDEDDSVEEPGEPNIDDEFA